MKYVFNNAYKYVDEQAHVFNGVIPRDLVVGDQYDSYNMTGTKKNYEVTVMEKSESGSIIVSSKEV